MLVNVAYVSTWFAQRKGIYVEKPGMGVEPIYSCSAGNRLNRSATPANKIIENTKINSFSAVAKLSSNLSINVQGGFFRLHVLDQHASAVEQCDFIVLVVEYDCQLGFYTYLEVFLDR